MWHQLGRLDLADVPALLDVRRVYEPDPARRERYRTVTERLAALHPHLVPPFG